jgi:hypothetical protein
VVLDARFCMSDAAVLRAATISAIAMMSKRTRIVFKLDFSSAEGRVGDAFGRLKTGNQA